MSMVDKVEQGSGKYGESLNKWSMIGTKGIILFGQGDSDDGLAMIIRARDEFVRVEAQDSYCHMHVGTAHRRMGNNRAALDAQFLGLEIAHKKKQHYVTAMCNSNIGASYISINDKVVNHHLLVAEAYARRYGFNYVLTQIYFHRARYAYEARRLNAAKTFIETSLVCAAKYSHNHFIIQEGRIFPELLVFALEQEIENEYLVEIFKLMGPDVIPYLKPLLSSKSSEIRLRAARVLSSAGGSRVAPLIKKLLKDEDKEVKDFAVSALKQMRSNLEENEGLLTKREGEVFRLMGKGLSNAEIAEQLFISELTVKTHVTKIFRKLGLTRRSQVAVHMNQKHKTQPANIQS
jgi:DNA-binding CsgD family transcriptional regulator